MQEAYLRGMERAMGQAMPESFRLSGEQKGTSPQQGDGLMQLSQNSTQAGGMSSPVEGGAAPKMLASGWMQQFANMQPTAVAAPAEPTTSDLFSRYLQSSLQGNEGLPAGQFDQAMATGMDVINRQAATGSAGMADALGARGLLHSGVMARGMGDVEQARLGQVGALMQDMIARQLEAARVSQRDAAGLLAASQRQQTALDAAEPSLWDRVAQLVGTGAQWYYGRPQTTQPVVSYAPPAQTTTTAGPVFPY